MKRWEYPLSMISTRQCGMLRASNNHQKRSQTPPLLRLRLIMGSHLHATAIVHIPIHLRLLTVDQVLLRLLHRLIEVMTTTTRCRHHPHRMEAMTIMDPPIIPHQAPGITTTL
jgi:hypothetical protein